MEGCLVATEPPCSLLIVCKRTINHTSSPASVDALWPAAPALCVSPTPSAVTFCPSCRWLSDGLPLPGSSPFPPTGPHVTHPLALLPLAADAPLIKRRGQPIGRRSSEEEGGKEGIDLSVVLEDQLIPIVCASTDSPMCLIRYGLFLPGQDKSWPHHSHRVSDKSNGIERG